MSVSQWAQSHRRSILFFVAVLAVAGMVAALKLPVSLFPTVDFPRVVVSLGAGDQPAEQMELRVTRIVEEAVRRVPGVRSVRSTTSRGSAEISINFDWGGDMASSTLQVDAAIAQVSTQLPPATTITTRRMDPTVFPIIAYSLTSSSLTATQLHDLAQYQLRPVLSSVEGVSRIQVDGGAIGEFRVSVDPASLLAHGLTLDDVSKAITASNVIQAVGRLEDHYKLYLVVSNTQLQTVQQIGQIILQTTANGVVHVSDVATVSLSTTPQWIRVTADGKDAVLFSIYQQPGSNSVQIAKDIKARLAQYQSQLPPGVRVANWYDQSELVLQSASSVRDAILIGVGLSAAVLLLFLRNLKITVIAVIVVPAVLSATVVLLHVLGMSFNIMTLGGMAAAVGLIIDDAIVMIEHIMRRLRGGDDRNTSERVQNAALEFIRPLAGSSASTLIIFVPLAFLTGVSGAFFKALSVTMAAALFISFLVAWLAIPILANRFLNEKDANQKEGGRVTDWVQDRYQRLLGRLIGAPLLVLLGVVPLLVAGWFAFHAVGSGFMPAMDEGGFILDYRSSPGTALSETDRLLRQVEGIIQSMPEVATYSRRTGTGLGGGLSETNQGDFFVRLKPPPRRAVDAIMDDVRTRIERDVPGLSVEMAQLMEDVIGDLTAVPQPVEIKIFSDNAQQLGSMARKVAADIAHIPGVVDVKNGINPAGDALDIQIDRLKAAAEGITPDAVTQFLDGYLSGVVATQIATNTKMVGVRVWTPDVSRGTDQSLAMLSVRAPDGHLFPLNRIATFTKVSGQPEISRENLKRMVAVTARISGRDLGSVVGDVKQHMTAPGLLPATVTYELGGLYEQQQIAFRGLIGVFASATILVFLLLLFMYESFRLALSILATALLAVSAVFIGLWVTSVELNISAMMGMTMIIGMVTEVAIFYFSEQQELLEAEGLKKSMVSAGVNRMRPIAMTTIAAILTLLPLAFALGQGSEMQQPLAIAIISGLVVQLPLVLFVMPVMFYSMRNRKQQDQSTTI